MSMMYDAKHNRHIDTDLEEVDGESFETETDDAELDDDTNSTLDDDTRAMFDSYEALLAYDEEERTVAYE